MSWQPVNKTIEEKPLIDNLLAFMAANQESALEWANGEPGLKAFVKMHNSATGRVDTIFPVLMISSTRLLTDLDGDLLEAVWQIEIEMAVAGPKADAATVLSHKYVQAVESMLANIPGRTLTNDCEAVQIAVLRKLATEFDVLRRRSANEFLQVAVIGAEWTLRAASY